MTLTACLIVRNEKPRLERCLRSVRPHVDELVVVDTGSDDGTPDVARRCGADIVVEEPERTVDIGDGFRCLGDFGAARNRSIELASGTHVVVIDADTVYVPPTFRAIRMVAERDDVHAMALLYHIARKTNANPFDVVKGDRMGLPFQTVAVFRREHLPIYDGIIHETGTAWLDAREREGTRQVTLGDSRVADYGHAPNIRAPLRKDERNERMLRRAIALDPGNPVPYTYLASTLVSHQRYDDAGDVLACLEAIADDPRLAGSHALRFIVAKGLCAFHRGDVAGTWEAARSWEISGGMDHPDIDTLKGLACEFSGRPADARIFYARALSYTPGQRTTQNIISDTARLRLEHINAQRAAVVGAQS